MFEKVCEILADKFDADASTMTSHDVGKYMMGVKEA